MVVDYDQNVMSQRSPNASTYVQGPEEHFPQNRGFGLNNN